MKVIETTRCREAGHPEFRLRIDSSKVIDQDVRLFVTNLESLVLDGEHFGDGETIQVGWSLLKSRANLDGTLALLEPDFIQMPIRWVNSVTNTLKYLRLHKDACESYLDGGLLDLPSLLQPCIVCQRLKSATRISMNRAAPESTDTGWFIGCADEDHDHNDPEELRSVSLYEAILENGQPLPYLGFPVGAAVETTNGALPTVFYSGEKFDPKPGSYFDDRANRGGRLTKHWSSQPI